MELKVQYTQNELVEPVAVTQFKDIVIQKKMTKV